MLENSKETELLLPWGAVVSCFAIKIIWYRAMFIYFYNASCSGHEKVHSPSLKKSNTVGRTKSKSDRPTFMHRILEFLDLMTV